MKLLLDANISWRLVAKLKLHFDDCVHVDNIGVATPAKDIEIWNYALNNDCIIATNDEDFLNLLNIKGFPPKVVLLKTGNQSNNFILELLIKHAEDICFKCIFRLWRVRTALMKFDLIKKAESFT